MATSLGQKAREVLLIFFQNPAGNSKVTEAVTTEAGRPGPGFEDYLENSEIMVKVARADPTFLNYIIEDEMQISEYIADSMVDDDIESLNAAKEKILTKDNATNFLQDAALEDRFPSPKVLDWFLKEGLITDDQLVYLASHVAKELNPETIAFIAKTIPLDDETLAGFLGRIDHNIDGLVREVATFKDQDEKPIERFFRKPVPRLITDGNFPLLKPMYHYQLVEWEQGKMALNTLQADIAKLVNVRESLLSLSIANKISTILEDLKKQEKKKERYLSGSQTSAPTNEVFANYAEKQLRSAGWFFDQFEKKYGKEALLKGLDKSEYGPELSLELLKIYRQQAKK